MTNRAAVLMLTCLTGVGITQAKSVDWVEVEQQTPPSERAGHAMVYDTHRDVVVLFGGHRYSTGGGVTIKSPLGDHHEWNGKRWSACKGTLPPGRYDHAMAYDPERRRIVMFGGDRYGLLADTWIWDGERWKRHAGAGPSARKGHGMAWDPVGKRVLLFGGEIAGKKVTNDLWAWDGQGWKRLREAGKRGSPDPRAFAAVLWQPTKERLLVYGGCEGYKSLSDLWGFDGTRWRRLIKPLRELKRRPKNPRRPEGESCLGYHASSDKLYLWNVYTWELKPTGSFKRVKTIRFPPSLLSRYAATSFRGGLFVFGGKVLSYESKNGTLTKKILTAQNKAWYLPPRKKKKKKKPASD